MIVYDKTFNGIRYSIWALKTVENPDGGTDSDCQEAIDWTDDHDQALDEADCFRATFNAAPPEDPEDWEAVGDYYYDTCNAAWEAIRKHIKEYLKESIDDNNTWNAAMAHFKKTQI